MSRKSLFLGFAVLGMLLLSACIQEAEPERIPVQYTVLVRDGVSGKPLQGAAVELTGESGGTRSLKTSETGRVTFPSVESYVNQVIVSKNGYVPTDTVDVVTTADSTMKLMLRTLNLTLVPEGSEVLVRQVYSYTVTVLDQVTLEPVPGAAVSVRSGNSGSFSAATASNGRAILDSLPSRQNLFGITAAGYIPFDTVHVASESSVEEEVFSTLQVKLEPVVSE